MRFKTCWLSLGIICIFTLTPHFLEADGSRQAFAKHPNTYFIETGSYVGDGIQMALDAGFKRVLSIELSPYYYKKCCERFSSNNNVEILQGDSGEVLEIVLQSIDEPATIWLDGHFSVTAIPTAKGATHSPILQELVCIGKHSIKTHTLMIDDIRLLGTIYFDFIELDEIIQAILAINPQYEISFEDGYVPNDILIAKISR